MVQESRIITTEESGSRLDSLLASKYPQLSRTYLQKLINDGVLRLNGAAAKSNYRLKVGDLVEFSLPENQELPLQGQQLNLEICYQDQDCAVINKPKGLIVHPATSNREVTMVHGLLAQLDDLSGINGTLRPGIVHRIDKDTSGLVIVAKNDKAHRYLAQQLVDKSLKRSYYALVHGSIDHDYGTIDAPIGRDEKDRKKMTVTAKNSKKAVTHFKVIERYQGYCLLDCELETGRTHQIRVHLQYIGHPLVGDEKYGFKKTLATNGQMLHAYKLQFLLPSDGSLKTVEIGRPEEFEALLASLLRKDEGDDKKQ